MIKNTINPDYIFEVSWEVCNKVGGIHTVISTKALTLKKQYKDKLIFIGPDIWKDTTLNSEFEEDKSLFRTWKVKAANDGLRIRTGRWNIPGNPIAILVDFTTFIPEKDTIFAKFWELYKLDSLSGQWDYVESALFGYATGKVIESFYCFNLSSHDRVLAHFHEWMTGSGVLFLKDKLPHIATLFTTHATMMGRVLSSNNQPLYEKLEQFDGDYYAQRYNVVSKNSLEKLAAINSSCFTTVSEITARECKQFLHKEVDVVTPNGFEDNFVPNDKDLLSIKSIAREKLKQVTGALIGYKISENALFVGISGRYEFKNKGIDVFLETLSELNKNKNLKREVIAFFLIPANQHGARKDLIENLNNNEYSKRLVTPFISHYLADIDNDAILNRIKQLDFTNNNDEKVRIVFVPTYLNGHDDIFNLKYYDILSALDLTIFPSYYEPWGYTPLESIAFSVPTITTTLAGFGLWTNTFNGGIDKGVEVLNRNDSNTNELIHLLASTIISFSKKSKEEVEKIRAHAKEISLMALWSNFIPNYYKAYSIALKNTEDKRKKYSDSKQTESIYTPDVQQVTEPKWRKLFVESNLPEKFKGLEALSMNIWWSWNYKAIDLFQSIDFDLWEESKRNPIVFLKLVSHKQFTKLENEPSFINSYNTVIKEFNSYLSEKPLKDNPHIAYFSMEFGLNNNLKIYSGGLGILAGDYLKEASDSNVNMIGIGLLYKYGYFKQQLSINGEQLVELEPLKFSQLPLIPIRDSSGIQKTIDVELPGRQVTAKIWQVNVGRIQLYLLDTNHEANSEQDRSITNQLYGGDWENRLKQEILLGIGGIRAIRTLNLSPDLYHCNEGHAAFINVERLSHLTAQENYNFDEALEIVRNSSLFTTHTPVPAGHDTFSEDLIRTYLRHIPELLRISWERFLGLGKVNINDLHEKFSMSILAAKTSQEMNGVSWLHGKVTREMFEKLYPGYFAEELFINYVTNGVHYATWTSKEWRKLYENEFGSKFLSNLSDPKYWEKIYAVEDSKIWNIKQTLRKKLIDYIKIRFEKNWIRRHEDPKKLVEILNSINENTLTIGFARRFATYKRAHLLFTDMERLSKIVNNEKMPVQIIFAGKAHPNDKAGQDLIKYIVEISRKPEFIGKILFLENYDMELAKRLVKGVDIWLNTPTRPLEASGTSGQKAVMNGVLNFSVLDGWWLEGYREGAGWAIDDKRTYENQDFQNELDAQTIYNIFENEIIPTFYNNNKEGIPVDWIQYIKKCIAEIAPNYTTKRMIDDYSTKFYNKMYERLRKIKENDYQSAIQLATWKRRILKNWNNIEIVSVDAPNTSKHKYNAGEDYHIEVVLDLKDLINEDICVEIVVKNSMNEQKIDLLKIEELNLEKRLDTLAFYKLNFKLADSGIFDFGLRIFVKNEDLPHRQDFNLVKWI